MVIEKTPRHQFGVLEKAIWYPWYAVKAMQRTITTSVLTVFIGIFSVFAATTAAHAQFMMMTAPSLHVSYTYPLSIPLNCGVPPGPIRIVTENGEVVGVIH